MSQNTITAQSFKGFGGDLSGVALVDASGNIDMSNNTITAHTFKGFGGDLSGVALVDASGNIDMGDNTITAHTFKGFGGDLSGVALVDASGNIDMSNNMITAQSFKGFGGDLSGVALVDASGNIVMNNNTITAFSFHGDGSDLSGVALVDASKNIVMNNNTITAKSFHGDGSDLSGVALVDASGNIVMKNNTITAKSFHGDGSDLSGVALVDASGNIDMSNNKITAKSFHGDGSDLSGVVTLDTSNNVTLYGNLKIMSGGNLIIEDVSNTSITQLKTYMKISDVLDIQNEGTNVALTVNQNDPNSQYNIASFQDASSDVFTIGHSGDTTIKGKLDVCGNATFDSSITCDGLVVGGINMAETQTTSNINVGEIVDIYVKLYGSNHPYYFFYRDADATQQMLTQPTLYLNKTYRFTRIDGGHPFYISDQGYEQDPSAITISGDGTPTSGITNGQSFTLTFNSLTTTDTLTYFCTAHSNMQHVFALKASEEETKTALTISDDVDLGAKTITAGTFIGDGSQLSGVALIDASGNLDLSNNTIAVDNVDTNTISIGEVTLSTTGSTDGVIDIYIKYGEAIYEFYSQDNDLSENRLPDNPTLYTGNKYRFQYLSSDQNRHNYFFILPVTLLRPTHSFDFRKSTDGNGYGGVYDSVGGTAYARAEFTGTAPYYGYFTSEGFRSEAGYHGSANDYLSINGVVWDNVPITYEGYVKITYIKYTAGLYHHYHWRDNTEGAKAELTFNFTHINAVSNYNGSGDVWGRDDPADISGLGLTYDDGQYLHYVVTVSGTTQKIYLNGTLIQTLTNQGQTSKPLENPFRLGYNDGPTTFTGYYGYFNLYIDTALSEAQVQTLYAKREVSTNTLVPTNLVSTTAPETISFHEWSGSQYYGSSSDNIRAISENESFVVSISNSIPDGYILRYGVGLSDDGSVRDSTSMYFDVSLSTLDISGNVSITGNLDLGVNKITAGTFIGDGSQLSGIAMVDENGNLDLGIKTITAGTFIGDGSQLSGVALIDASGNLDLSNNTLTTKAIKFNETTPPADNDIGTLGNLRFNASRDLLEYYGKDNIWNSLTTYKSEQPPKLRNASFSSHSQYIDLSWDMFETRITDSHDGKKYPLSLQTYVDISYDFGDASSNGWETLYIGNGTYDNDGNENIPVFETFRLYGLQTTDYSNNTGYSIAFNSKPDPISTALPSFDQSSTPFDLRLYGVNQSGQAPNYVYLYGILLEPTGAPGPVEVTATRDFQQNQFTMDLSFALNSLNPSTTTGIDITQYDVSFHMVESKRFASADPIDHSGVYQIVWDGISGLSNTEIDLSNLYPGAKYDVMVRAQNRGLAGVDGSYGDTSFTSTDFTNVGATQYITLNDLEPVNPQGMTFTLVNSASIRCCISGNSFLSPLTIMNNHGGIDMSGISDFYVNFGKQGVDISSAGTLVTALFKKYSNNSVVSEYTTQIQYSSVKSDTSYTFLGCDLDLGDYIDKGNAYEYNNGFVYGSSIQKSSGANIDFNAYFNASINAHKCTYTNTQFSGQITTDYFYKDNYDISDHAIVYVTTPASISIVSESVTTLCGIPSIHQLQVNAVVDISNFASYLIPHDNSNNHSFINELTTNSYYFPPNQIKTVSSPAKYSFPYSEIADVSNGTYESNTSHTILANVYYLDHSGSPALRTKTHTMVLNNLGKIFKDSVTSYNGLPVHIFNSQVSSNALNVSNVLTNNYTLMYFDGHFVGDNYSKIYNGTTINAYSDWSKTNGGYGEDGPDYSTYVGSGSYGYKWIAFDVTTLRTNNVIPLSELYLNDMHIEHSVFGVDYKAFIIKKKGNTQIFGTLGKRSMIGQSNWWLQNYSIFQNSETGNGALNNDGDVFVELVDTSVLYYILIGLPVNSTSYVRFI
jgi:hypothetical protein